MVVYKFFNIYSSLFEMKNMKPQRNRHKSFPAWCVPRKTKTVSSAGEIFIDLTSASNVKKKKSRNRTVSFPSTIIHSECSFFLMYFTLELKLRTRISWVIWFQKAHKIQEKAFQSQQRINELSQPRKKVYKSSLILLK